MKNIKILFLLSLFSFFTVNVSAAAISKIEALDNNTIELTASEDVVFSDTDIEAEIKLLKDIDVSFSARDPENPKKVLLNLTSDIISNTSYELISILWAEWNVDFSIWDFLEWEIMNKELSKGEVGIEKINVVDSKTIELFFTNDLEDEVFEFKIYSEVSTNWVKSEWNNKLTLEVTKNLELSTSYIVMIILLKDASWTEISLDETLYDLTTPETLEKIVEEEEVIIAETEEKPEVIADGNVEEVALSRDETPETGTTTSVLVILALLVNLGFFIRKKIIK